MTRHKHHWQERFASITREVRGCQCGAVEHRRLKDVPQGETRERITDESAWGPWRKGEW